MYEEVISATYTFQDTKLFLDLILGVYVLFKFRKCDMNSPKVRVVSWFKDSFTKHTKESFTYSIIRFGLLSVNWAYLLFEF